MGALSNPFSKTTIPNAFHGQRVLGVRLIIIIGCCFGISGWNRNVGASSTHHFGDVLFVMWVQNFWWLYDHWGNELGTNLPKAMTVETMEYFCDLVFVFGSSWCVAILWEGLAWPFDQPLVDLVSPLSHGNLFVNTASHYLVGIYCLKISRPQPPRPNYYDDVIACAVKCS